MGGETERNISGWTTDTLKEYFDARLLETEKRLQSADQAADVRNEQRFTAQQQAIKDALTSQKEAVAAALVAAEKAVLVAETNAEKWRAASNEWRGAMNDRERNLMPRTETEKGMQALADKLDSLATRMDRNEGRSGGLNAGWGILVGAVGLLAALIAIFFTLKG